MVVHPQKVFELTNAAGRTLFIVINQRGVRAMQKKFKKNEKSSGAV
jgi:hypothetical protein